MAESGWEALAEFELSLYGLPKSQAIYCLCSRVFLRSSSAAEVDPVTIAPVVTARYEGASKVSAPKHHQVIPLLHSHSSFESHCSRPHGRTDDESVSCYHSASHTDNNYSTDEYESQAQQVPLQHAPVDTDLVSKAHLDEELYIEISQESELPYSNSMLMPTFTDPDLVRAWDRYWAENGQRLTWESWIGKYGDRVSPSLSWESRRSSDSMTTVTQITVSSLDEDLLSVKSSSQFSEQSSDPETADVYWQEIWRQHCEEQYNMSYGEFVQTHRDQIEPDTQFSVELDPLQVHPTEFDLNTFSIEPQNLDSYDSPMERDSSDCSPEHKRMDGLSPEHGVSSGHKHGSSPERKHGLSLEHQHRWGPEHQQMDGLSPEHQHGLSLEHQHGWSPEHQEMDGLSPEHKHCCRESQACCDGEDHSTGASGDTLKEETVCVQVQSGGVLEIVMRQPQGSDTGDDPPEEKPFNVLKRGFASSVHDDLPPVYRGTVSYHKRNIKGQNRQLRLNPRSHIRFDDDGNPMPVFPQHSTLDKVKQFLQQAQPSVAPDEAIKPYSSSDEEEGASKLRRPVRPPLQRPTTSNCDLEEEEEVEPTEDDWLHGEEGCWQLSAEPREEE
ncbi:hypothetical protein B566_EDAN009734, partial [Ephemera danica]